MLGEKKLKTITGLEFFWPDTKMTPTGFVTNTQSIYNYPIQSLCTADIIPICLVYFWHRVKLSGAEMFIVNTIHDSIITELPEEERELYVDLSREAFSTDLFNYLEKVYDIKWNVPLGMGVKYSEFWSEGEEYTEDFEPPYVLEEQ